MSHRLRPFSTRVWLDATLSLGSIALLLVGGWWTVRAVLASSDTTASYLPGISALVAGVFGLALAEGLSLLHQTYRRIAEVESSLRDRIAEAESRINAHSTSTR